MRKIFLALLMIMVSLPVFADDGPVEDVVCKPGSTEYGNEIIFKFSKKFRYGQLVIKRTAANSDYVKDLSAFAGGSYRLDIAAKGGITAYTLQYGEKEATELREASGDILCAAEPAEVTVTPSATPPTSEPTTSTTPTTPTPPATDSGSDTK